MKYKLNILIIDDEQLAINYLQSIVEDYNLLPDSHFNINIIKTFSDSRDIMDYITNSDSTIHLVFLDINMPFKNGIQISEEIKDYKEDRNTRFPICCLTTAHNDYALKAFENGIFDYLLKPIDKTKIKLFFNKLYKYINFEDETKYLDINTNGILTKIDVKTIIFVNSDGKYLNIRTKDKNYLINDSLSNFENKYNNFLKVHRSYLVNKKLISKLYKKYTQWYILINGYDEPIPISRRIKNDIEEELSILISKNNQ